VSKIIHDYLWIVGVFLPLYLKEKLGIANLASAPWNRSNILVVLLLKARQLIYAGYANSEKFHSKGISLNWIDMPISTARTKCPSVLSHINHSSMIINSSDYCPVNSTIHKKLGILPT
jgi:hypothetical protein